MYDFGADANSNNINFGDLNALDAPAAYSLALVITFAAPGNVRYVFTKIGGGEGWALGVNAAGGLYTIHDANSSSATGTAKLTSGTHTVVCTWDGSNNKFYVDGGSPETEAQATAITANAQAVVIGTPSAASGGPFDMGQVMWWDAALTDEEAQSYHGGIIPQPSSLKFWSQCHYDPGYDMISQTNGTKGNTVNIVEDPFPTWPVLPTPATAGRLSYITYVYKVISETMGLAETRYGIRFPYEVVDETMGVSEGVVRITKPQKVIDETMGVPDYCEEGSGEWDPDGIITETMSDGTVWTRKFPPFARRTNWTED